MNEEFESIIAATESFIETTEAKSVDEFYLIRHFNNIVLEKELKDYNLLYYNKVSLKKNIKYVLGFLENINPEYKDYFINRLNDDIFIFDYETKEETPYSEIDDETKERVIYIPVENTIEDSFAIVHELMHDINIEELEKSITRYLFTETLSLLSEFLFEDYLKDKKIKDLKITNNRNLFFANEKAIEVDINLNLIEQCILNGYIDSGIIINILENYPAYYIPNIAEAFKKIRKNNSLTLDDEQPYIIGVIIATYMYNRIKEKRNNIEELFELNQMILTHSFDDILDYLELTYNDFDLDEKSYTKLRNSYQKYLKSR